MEERDALSDNSQHLYLNASPGLSHLLDLTQLDTNDPSFAYNWLNNLLKKGQVQLSFRPDFPITETLQHLYFSARNHERVKGLAALGFGYPLLVWSQGEAPIIAPLFIWQVSLTPAPETPGTWILTHRDSDRVVFNRKLVATFREEHQVDLEPTLRNAIRQGQAGAEALINACTEVEAMLGIENTSQNIALAEFPVAGELGKLFDQGSMQWSGVLGFFPPVFPLETQATAETLPEAELKQKHPFGMLPLDPYQASALQTVYEHQATLVRGAAGTGKTHLLVHLLTNALSNGKRCLVVAENVGALRQVQKRLEQLGLLPYSFLLQDGVAEKPVLLNTLRTIANTEAPAANFDEAGFRIALDKCKRLKTKLDENYKNLRQDIFGPHNWTETVGLFLRSNRLEGKELLASHLHNQDFKFDYEEYLQLRENVRLSQSLYQQINTLRHPLGNLHPHIFTRRNLPEGLQFVTQQINTFLEKAQKLHHRYIAKTNFYADRLEEQYEGTYGEFANALVRLKDQIADYSTKFGADFDQAGAGALKLRGVFSGKYKSVLEARDEVALHYLTLVRKFEQERPFDFQFPPALEGKNVQKVKQNLELFEKALSRWRESFPALVQDEMQRLTGKNGREELGVGEQLEELEKGLDQLVNALNEQHVYQEVFENKMLTIPKRQKYLEEILEQLENTRLYLREYEQFYAWQRHWLQLSENATKIIRALVKVKPGDWGQAFESWYLHNCLNLYGNENLIVDEKSIPNFVSSAEQLKKLLPGQIAQTVRQEREEAFKKLRRNNRETYALYFDRKSQELPKDKGLPALLEPILHTVTTIFPIILATPHAVAAALPAHSGVFDYLLADEAQYLQLSEWQFMLPMAKKAVFFEEAGQLPLPEHSAISDWAAANALPTVFLKNVHRHSPGNVLESQNGAASAFAIHFTQVDGRFEESTGTNEDEAQHIIHLLNEVKPTSQRTFPTVGIVCFTIAQRDLIASYLLKIKQKWSFGAEKIQQLERNGLGVFYLDELRGQHFDVLMVSTTYGIRNAKGELTEQTNILNSGDLLRHLQLLMSRPLRELFIANSIPTGTLENWLNQPQQPGYFLLANYLIHNQLSNKNHEFFKKRLSEWLHPQPPLADERIFVEEVATALQPYLGESRAHIGSLVADQYPPLLIQGIHDQQPLQWLQPDAFFAQTLATDYEWEAAQRTMVMQIEQGYQPFWSVNWWKNPRQEARRLSGVIIKNDNDFAKANGVATAPDLETLETPEEHDAHD